MFIKSGLSSLCTPGTLAYADFGIHRGPGPYSLAGPGMTTVYSSYVPSILHPDAILFKALRWVLLIIISIQCSEKGLSSAWLRKNCDFV